MDVLLGDVRSLKAKRAVVRPLIAELRRRFPGVAVGETGHLDLHRRAEIGVAGVSPTAGDPTEGADEGQAPLPGRAGVGARAAPAGRFTAEGGPATGAARHRRLAERIAVIVAEMLERRVKDPRLGFVTVTEARLTADLREATVFYTVYGSAEEREETAAALRSATGIVRTEVG